VNKVNYYAEAAHTHTYKNRTTISTLLKGLKVVEYFLSWETVSSTNSFHISLRCLIAFTQMLMDRMNTIFTVVNFSQYCIYLS